MRIGWLELGKNWKTGGEDLKGGKNYKGKTYREGTTRTFGGFYVTGEAAAAAAHTQDRPDKKNRCGSFDSHGSKGKELKGT
eukprot:1146237-Pelagomonas_calceolata.AAC.2